MIKNAKYNLVGIYMRKTEANLSKKQLKKIKNPKKLKTVSLKNKGHELQRLFY